jgi:exo-1,4-beta-D-glucosaminidase
MFEAFRRNKYTSTGVIQWMLDNAWPSLIWHLYDFYLRPGGSYFGAKEANEPLHVQYSYDDRSVVVVNATRQAHPGLHVTARVLDLDSRERLFLRKTLDVAADGTHVALTLPEPADIAPTYFVWLGLQNGDGDLLSSNFYWLSTTPDVLDFERSKWYVTPVKAHADLTALRHLPKARLEVSIRHAVEDGQGVTRVVLVNPSEHLAFGARLKLLRGVGGDEVLPILWDDNYLAVLPGETREIAARYAPADLGGREPRVTVEAWNAHVAER